MLKAEVVRSNLEADEGENTTAKAWLADTEYKKDKLQASVYANQQDEGFGLGQQSGASEGERKFGVTANYQLTDDQILLSVASKLLILDSEDNRTRASVEWQKRSKNSKFLVGLSHTEETISDVKTDKQAFQVGASTVLADGKLSLQTKLEKSLSSLDTESRSRSIKAGCGVSNFRKSEFVCRTRVLSK